MPVFGERKNSSKSGVVWEREGRNQGSRFSRVLGSYSWGLIPGLIDCNELLVSEKNSREKHPLCPVSSSSQVLQALKFCLRGRQRSLSVSSKLSSPGENFFPTTTKGTRERISCAKSKGCLEGSSSYWSSRQEEKELTFLAYHGWLCLGLRASLWWGRTVSQGWKSSPSKWIFMPLTSTLTGPISVDWQEGVWSSTGFSFLLFAIL